MNPKNGSGEKFFLRSEVESQLSLLHQQRKIYRSHKLMRRPETNDYKTYIGGYRNVSLMRGNANCLGYYNPFAEEKVRVTNSSFCCDDGSCCACGNGGSPLQRLYPSSTASTATLDRPYQCWYDINRNNIPHTDPLNVGMNCSGYDCKVPPQHKTEYLTKEKKPEGGMVSFDLGRPKFGQPPKGIRKTTRPMMDSTRQDLLPQDFPVTRKPLATPTRRPNNMFVTTPVILPESSLAYGLPQSLAAVSDP
jgi:hypothetical protein